MTVFLPASPVVLSQLSQRVRQTPRSRDFLGGSIGLMLLCLGSLPAIAAEPHPKLKQTQLPPTDVQGDRDPSPVARLNQQLAQTPDATPEETPAETPEAAPEDTADDTPEVEIFIERILEQPVFAPFRQIQPLSESSRPVYVIPREQIDVQGAITVQDALRFAPGVLSEGTTGGQLGAASSQFVRGGDSSQTLILLNGRPINDLGFSGDFDLAALTTDFIDRIEVSPGGSSTLYGSSGVGGTINLVSQRPTETPEVSLSVGAGNFGFNQQIVQTRGSAGDIGWVVGYNRTYSNNDFPFELETIDFEGDRENADVNYNNLNLTLTADVGDRNRLTFSGLYLSRDFGVAGGVPTGAGSLGQFNSLTPDARQYTEDLLLDVLWESELGRDRQSLLTVRAYSDFLDYTFRNPDTTRDEVDRSSFGFQAQHNWQIAAAHNLTYGLDFRSTQAENETFSFFSGETTRNYDDNIDQGAAFARYDVDVTPDLSVNLGVRQEFNSLENGSFTSPSAGLRWSLSDATTLRANYARSFNAPLLSELEGLAAFDVDGNPDLRSERGNSFDIGLDQKISDFGLLRLTLFLNNISDLVAFQFGTPSTFVNVGETRTLGLEAALDVEITRNVVAFANLTLNDTKILEDSNEAIEGNDLSFRDADSFNFGVAYVRPNGFYAGVLLHHISEFFVDNANTETLGNYTTVDVKLQMPLGDNVRLNASVNNLFDEQYEVFPGFPGLSRNIQASLNWTF